MYKFKKSLITLIGLLSLMTIVTVVLPHTSYGSGGTGSSAPTTQTQNVKVVNSNSEPVPVQAAQSGTWNVGINGTPNVNVSNMPTVGINSAANTVKIDSANPLSARDADNPAKQPFHVGANLSVLDGNITATAAFDVPAGKRAVIEDVSVLTLLQPGQRPLILLSTIAAENPTP